MAAPTRAELDGLIRERLATDPGFRATLLADPRAAISDLIGVALPPFVDIEVHEETLTHLHVTIPVMKNDSELSEDDLELVAGGGACWDNCGCSM